MTARHAFCGLICAVAVLAAGATEAQPAQGRVEVSGGAAWLGASKFAPVLAQETTPAGGRRTVFVSDTTLESSTGPAVRVGVRLMSSVRLETGIAVNQPALSTRITGDVEPGAVDTSASETITQYAVEGGVVAGLRRRQTGRLIPFAAAGGAYLRQLHEGRTLVQTGRAYYVGGGAHYLLRQGGGGRIKSAGIRADLRATIMKDGVAPADAVVPFLGAALFVRF